MPRICGAIVCGAALHNAAHHRAARANFEIARTAADTSREARTF
jgi:hypothetical protein